MKQQNNLLQNIKIMHGIAVSNDWVMKNPDIDSIKKMQKNEKEKLQKNGIRCTIVFKECTVKKDKNERLFKLSYAICSSKDVFSKKIGRKIAQERLNSERYTKIISGPNYIKNVKNYISNKTDVKEWMLNKINSIEKINTTLSYVDILF
jgi:hypothetical protein